MDKDQFSQTGIIPKQEKTLDDFFDIKGGILRLKSVMETINFISGIKGVRIDPQGLTATGGTINGATIGPSNALTVTQGGTGATSLTGILKGNGTSTVTTITPLAGTKIYWVSDSNGGSVNRKLTFTDGILTNET